MISTNGRSTLQRFVTDAKNLLMDNVTAQLNQHYGIWEDGTVQPWQRLATRDAGIIYRAKLLRQRLEHIKNNLPESTANRDRSAVRQLTAEQAFTTLNRFCALRMCEERELIPQSVGGGFDSIGFQSYDMVTGQGRVGSRFERYCWFLESMFDELSVELPSVFDRYSPYGLIMPDETTMVRLFDLLNSESLTAFYDPGTGDVVNFWKENETLGWIFQYYNSLEERRKVREESTRPRNSREMAIRNQFFTPDYVVRFLTDNSLGRIWYEMTAGNTDIAEICKYMVRRPDEMLPKRDIKEPTDLSMLDPACGSMHFGLYSFDVLEAIYMDAWDHQPDLLQTYRYELTREQFRALVPKLILENNIHGVEIDPRALQIAALSLWLRAQQSWSELGIPREERPMITKSGLVLAEPMPGNKRLLEQLIKNLDKPMQRLVKKVWDVMKHVDEAGMLIRVEHEIEAEIEELRKNWGKVNRTVSANLFSDETELAKIDAENRARAALRSNKDAFFSQIKERLQEALRTISTRLSDEEGYENTLFANDAVRGFAFIELCQKRYDCILMNPPFGEGSENTVSYLDKNYENWCRNLVCAFFIRMQELLTDDGRLGAIFDRTVCIKSSYESFRLADLCGYITTCADTGWEVLDANVETSTLVLKKHSSEIAGTFIDVREVDPDLKQKEILRTVDDANSGIENKNLYIRKSIEFAHLPNAIIGYYFSNEIIRVFQLSNLETRSLTARKGHDFIATKHPRVFYETVKSNSLYHYYNGGGFSMFYMPSREMVYFNEELMRCDNTNLRNSSYQLHKGTGFGKRGEILDAHILHDETFFSAEGLAIPRISNHNIIISNSFLNSIVSQYFINLYCAQHKGNGYVNLLPMPGYESRQGEIEAIVKEIIDIKRRWFSLDETNLEYLGFLSRLIPLEEDALRANFTEETVDQYDGSNFSIVEAFDHLQAKLTADYDRYVELVKQNDDLWMDLADIAPDSEFRATLNDYKSRRPYEELLSIDGASDGNVINKQVLAKEIVMELVGMAFDRWDTGYATGAIALPEFDGIFDPLPFMPKVTKTQKVGKLGAGQIYRGYLPGMTNAPMNLVERVRHFIEEVFGAHNAANVEYELCTLVGVDNLEDYFNDMGKNGFFDYHLRRYTKSRRKAPIYWPVCSPDGNYTFWVYYPELTKETIPSILIFLSKEETRLETELQQARLSNDKAREARLSDLVGDLTMLKKSLETLNFMGYEPYHDDGVPVTAAYFSPVFNHREWGKFTAEMMQAIEDGEYDWSHLAYRLFKTRIEAKAKKDWCMALTHGLEEICENKPKPKRQKKSSSEATKQSTLFD